MIKKILPISVFVLIVVIIVLLGLQNMLNKNKPQQNSGVKPTLYQGKAGKSFIQPGNNVGKDDSPNITQITAEELKSILPVYAPDFSLEYSNRLQKYVVTTQTDEGGGVYNEWLAQNPSYENELQNVIITKQTIQELHEALDYAKGNQLTPEKKAQTDAKIFTDTLNTLINLPFLFMQSTTQPEENIDSPSPTPNKQTLKLTPTSSLPSPTHYALPSTSFTYYSQCSGPYDNVPLPQGCTICNAGCGPTSVAMILSSYIDTSLTPPKTIEIMEAKGARIGCFGSYISEIYSYLKGRGDLKISDFIIPSEKGLTADEVAKDLQGYTKSGWTIFVLANFKTDGGGHYFWVTDVKKNGDILAYDSYYGKQQAAPINENRYSPAPYYRYAFAIKKS